jgi:hypothetical protein
MSVNSLEQWAGFVRKLERSASNAPTGETANDDGLLERSQLAIQKVRRHRPERLRQALREALLTDNRTCQITEQTQALADLRWPLALTTNYDDLFVRAAEQRFSREPVRVVGRSESDCRRVLAALDEPGEPLLWACHGYLGNVLTASRSVLPESELVIGHEEYRRVIHNEAHFRRTFAEVVRNRSLLFLGCGLDDPDVLGLLEETLALVGPGHHRHYAVLFAREHRAVEKARMLELRIGVTTIVLGDYAALPRFLAKLKQRVDLDQPRQVRWAFHLRSSATGRLDGGLPEPDLEIVRGRLPPDVTPGSCLVVSAGEDPGQARRNEHGLYFSDEIRDLLRHHHVDVDKDRLYAAPQTVVEVPRRDGAPTRTIAAFARTPTPGASWSPTDSRNARAIFTATLRALDWARRERCKVARFQLLAAGASSPYPPRVALAQMLRAIGAHRANSRRTPRVVVHLVNEQLLAELSAGRLDVLELMQPDELRLWIEVHEVGHHVERVQRFERYDHKVGAIARSFFVDGRGWGLAVFPDPELKTSQLRATAELRNRTLAEIGLVPGSTLRFEWISGKPGATSTRLRRAAERR